MSELKIEKITQGRCSECGKDKPGVRFGLPFVGDTAFLCWEHYRLLLESMKPARVERVVEITEIRSSGCCCHSCCCHRRRTFMRGSYNICHSQSREISESQTEGQSRGESVGMSETRTVSRSESDGRSHSSGHSSSESH